MQVLGIVGAVASGKTLVSSILEEFGAVVLSGDEIAHQVLREPEIVSAIRERWGDSLLQIHDEVILEGPSESAEEALAIISGVMAAPYEQLRRAMRVELAVDANVGKTWYDAK